MATSSEYLRLEGSPRLCNVFFDWIDRQYTAYMNRITVIQQQRKENALLGVMYISVLIHGFFGAYIFIEAFNMELDVHIPFGPLIMMIVSALAFGVVPFIDLGTFLCWIGSLSSSHKEWMVGLVVDGIFELLGNIQSSEGGHSKLPANLYECVFIVLGVIICQIHLHFRSDHTGITNGAIVSVIKVLLGFGVVSYHTTTGLEWAYGTVLLASCFYFKFTEEDDQTNAEEGSDTAQRIEATAEQTVEAAADQAVRAADENLNRLPGKEPAKVDESTTDPKPRRGEAGITIG